MGGPLLDELPVAPISCLLLLLSSSGYLIFVDVGDLEWARVPLALCGAGGRIPDVGPVSYFYSHGSCSVLLVIRSFHLLLRHSVVVSRLSVVSSSGCCREPWQLRRDVPVEH